MEALRQSTAGWLDLPTGTIYPALHRLELRGWLQAEWSATETGREAKFYSLTRKGRQQLAAEVRSWEQTAAAVALILGVAE